MASHYCISCPCPLCAASTAATPIPFGGEIRDLVRRLTDDLHASEADNAALRERVAKLERAIRWACGEVEFDGWFPLRAIGQGPYYWRAGLRKRAALDDAKEPQ